MSREPVPGRWPVSIVLVVFALGVRIVVAARTAVVPRDSVVLLDLARRFLEGDSAEALSHAQHPLYPWCVSLISRTGLGLETAGTVLSVAAGALAVLPLLAIAGRVGGPRVATLTGLLYALSPYAARTAADPLTDGLHLLLVLLGAALGLRALDAERPAIASLGAGAALGLAYLTRPEGLLPAFALIPALVLIRRGHFRMVAPALLLAGLLLVAGPYLLHLREEHGAWTLTGKWKAGGSEKAEEWSRITGRERSSPTRATVEAGRELAITLHPAVALVAFIGLFGRGRPRAAAVTTLAIAALYVLASIRVHWLRSYLSHRHVLVPSALLIPFAARGVANVLGERLTRPSWKVAAALAVLIAAVLAPKTLAARRQEKRPLVDRGGEIAAAGLPGGPLALAGDARIAYYADRRFVAPPRGLARLPEERTPAALRARLEALTSWAASRGALLYLAPEEVPSGDDPGTWTWLPRGVVVVPPDPR